MSSEKESTTPATSGTNSSFSVSSDLSDAPPPARPDSSNGNGRWYYYLTPNAVKRLPEYKYQGEDQSPLYKYVLSPFASWCVDNLTPEWVAPNSITLFGLAWMVLSYLVIWFWCPGLYEANTDIETSTINSVPGVIFLLNGCAMLIYQTLDNMDGKQARKTGNGSALGLLFDHGCDAMNSVLGSANWIAAMAMIPGNVSDLVGNDTHGNIQSKSLLSEFFGGDAVLALLLILCPMIAFYISTWEHYHTGKLVLPPFNGPSEGLCMGASLSIASFFWGPMYWQTTSWADGANAMLGSYMGEIEVYSSWMQGRVRNMDLIVLAAVLGLAQEVTLKTISVARKYGLQSLRTTLPIVLLTASTFAMVHFDKALLLRSPRITMHLISGLFTEQTVQLMLDHITVEKFQVGLTKRWCLIPQLCLAAGMIAGVSPSPETLDTTLLIYTSGLWVYLAFKISVQIYEICDVLSIYCFDIVTPYTKEKSEVRQDMVGDNVPKMTDYTPFQETNPFEKKKTN